MRHGQSYGHGSPVRLAGDGSKQRLQVQQITGAVRKLMRVRACRCSREAGLADSEKKRVGVCTSKEQSKQGSLPEHASRTAKELVGGNSDDQRLRRRGAIDAQDKPALPRATHDTKRRQRHRQHREDRGGGDQPNTANGGVKRVTSWKKTHL